MTTPNTCPHCNCKNSFNFIDGFQSNRAYKTKTNFNDKTDVNLFINHYLIITPIQQLINQSPSKWLDNNIFSQNSNMSLLLPLYKLYTNDNEPIYIDYHLRQLIIWDEVTSFSVIEHRDGKCVYFSCNNVLLNDLLNYKNTIDITTTILKWVYEVMISLSDKYNFIYENTMNTFIIDIIILTINKNKDNNIGRRDHIYYVMIAAIYNCYSFYKNEGELDKEYLMSLTDDYEPDEDKLLHIAGIQKGYIEDYFEYLK
jgi:hypothetical protein